MILYACSAALLQGPRRVHSCGRRLHPALTISPQRSFNSQDCSLPMSLQKTLPSEPLD